MFVILIKSVGNVFVETKMIGTRPNSNILRFIFANKFHRYSLYVHFSSSFSAQLGQRPLLYRKQKNCYWLAQNLLRPNRFLQYPHWTLYTVDCTHVLEICTRDEYFQLLTTKNKYIHQPCQPMLLAPKAAIAISTCFLFKCPVPDNDIF